jgi:DNA processing protein
LLLQAVQGVGDALLCRLVTKFGSPDAVLEAGEEELVRKGGISPALAKAIRRGPSAERLRALDRELAAIERLPIRVLTILDPDYPPRLKTIYDPPPLLSVSGMLSEADHHAIAVVGTRQATPAGLAMAERLGRELAEAGFTVVSGLARGIDVAAHQGALNAGGRTIAVLGCGIDRTYPAAHWTIRKKIEAQGAVLSELPPGTKANPYHFPKRNRIISGLSLGVVVVEATLKSGSLITARLAADQGREVFAVPGPASSEQSRGTNGLIKQGARLVDSVDDILDELYAQCEPSFRSRLEAHRAAMARRDQTEGEVLAGLEARVYAELSTQPLHIDELIARTGLSASSVSSVLLALELKGLVRQLPGPACVKV